MYRGGMYELNRGWQQVSTSSTHTQPSKAMTPASSTTLTHHISPAAPPSTGSFLDRFFCGVFSPGKEKKEKERVVLHVADERPAPPLLQVVRGQHYYLGRVFRHLDEDGDGKISPSELRSCTRATVGEEVSEEEVESVVDSTDSDGDGLLGFDDFVRLVEGDEVGEEERTRDLREAFAMYATAPSSSSSSDAAGTATITPKSLRRMLARLGECKTLDECKLMIRPFDLDGDGVLCFHEFSLMMR